MAEKPLTATAQQPTPASKAPPPTSAPEPRDLATAPPIRQRLVPIPPPIPSAYDAVAYAMGVPRERLRVFVETYKAVYYDPNEPGTKFCRIRDITRGKVTMGPNMQFHVTHKFNFWPRDPRQRDPLEGAWYYFWRYLLARPSLEVLFERSFAPKWISPDEFMITDQWVPLRNVAPVYCDMSALGVCMTKYATLIWCHSGAVVSPVVFLAVTPVDPAGSGVKAARQRMGIWWAVPLARCIPLRMAVIGWPNANSNQNPDEVLVLGEDGFGQVLNMNYFLQDTSDPAIYHARQAFLADNPTTGSTAIPLRAPDPELARRMAQYTLTRYVPEDQVPSEAVDDERNDAEERAQEEASGEESAAAPAVLEAKGRPIRASLEDLYPN